jgi:hypothetical protein
MRCQPSPLRDQDGYRDVWMWSCAGCGRSRYFPWGMMPATEKCLRQCRVARCDVVPCQVVCERPGCGRSFVAKNRGAQFCSGRCRVAADRRRRVVVLDEMQ